MTVPRDFAPACPIPDSEYPHVLLAHGGGGRLMNTLIERVFAETFSNPALETRHDGAVLDVGGACLAFSTDSYVVHPLFFPGGDIGTLAVNGTVNDLAMCGARPLHLSAGFIIEEGLAIETLWRIARSMRGAADAAGVTIVTGDTKVVDRGKGDGVFITTAGIGAIPPGLVVSPAEVRPGDAVVLSGDIGRHGMAIMASREGLEFESRIESDCAPVAAAALALLEAGVHVHCMRDLTRGGLSSALVEIAEASRLLVEVDEAAIAVRPDVQAACEILGLDPMYVANEGRFVAFVPGEEADRAVEALRAHPVAAGAARIGRVTGASERGLVTLNTVVGSARVVDMLSGEQLPRIC